MAKVSMSRFFRSLGFPLRTIRGLGEHTRQLVCCCAHGVMKELTLDAL